MLCGGLGRRRQGDIAFWSLLDAPNVRMSVQSHLVYHLKIIIASRRTAERTGLSGFYISLDTVGDFLLQSQKMFLSMNGFVGQSEDIWSALLQHPVVKYGHHMLKSDYSSRSVPRWQRVFLSFFPLFKLLQMTADRIMAVPMSADIFRLDVKRLTLSKTASSLPRWPDNAIDLNLAHLASIYLPK